MGPLRAWNVQLAAPTGSSPLDARMCLLKYERRTSILVIISEVARHMQVPVSTLKAGIKRAEVPTYLVESSQSMALLRQIGAAQQNARQVAVVKAKKLASEVLPLMSGRSAAEMVSVMCQLAQATPPDLDDQVARARRQQMHPARVGFLAPAALPPPPSPPPLRTGPPAVYHPAHLGFPGPAVIRSPTVSQLQAGGDEDDEDDWDDDPDYQLPPGRDDPDASDGSDGSDSDDDGLEPEGEGALMLLPDNRDGGAAGPAFSAGKTFVSAAFKPGRR